MDNPPPRPEVSASRVSIAIGRLTLGAGRYPFRRQVGFRARRASRQRGGRRFLVRRDDEVTLDAWWSPAVHADQNAETPSPAADGRKRTDAPPIKPADKLPVVIAHGLTETKERHFKRAWKLNAMGHDVVLFDHRDHGRSGGRGVTFGVQEKQDLRAVIDNAARRGFIDVSRGVVTMGFSLGGGTVLQHAAVDPRVVGVVALAPFADLRSAINSFRQKLTPWIREDWLMSGFDVATGEKGYTIDEASAIEAFKRVDVPVLLVEGGRDPYLPGIEHVHRLAAAKSCGTDAVERGRACVRSVRIAGANHTSLVHRHWPKLDREIARFLREVAESSDAD